MPIRSPFTGHEALYTDGTEVAAGAPPLLLTHLHARLREKVGHLIEKRLLRNAVHDAMIALDNEVEPGRLASTQTVRAS